MTEPAQNEASIVKRQSLYYWGYLSGYKKYESLDADRMFSGKRQNYNSAFKSVQLENPADYEYLHMSIYPREIPELSSLGLVSSLRVMTGLRTLSRAHSPGSAHAKQYVRIFTLYVELDYLLSVAGELIRNPDQGLLCEELELDWRVC
jgi:hypothetical protein